MLFGAGASGHVRLLHRSSDRQSEGQPWRLHRQRRRQRAGSRRGEQQERARLLRLSPITSATRIGCAQCPSRRQMARQVLPSNSNRDRRQPTSRYRARCSSTCVTRPPQRAEVAGVHQVLPHRRRRARARKWATCRCRPQAYKLALQHFTGGKLGTVFGGVPEVGVTIDTLLAREGKL